MNDFNLNEFNKLIKDISIKIRFADDQDLIFDVANNKTFYSPEVGIRVDKPGVNLEFSHPINNKPVENVSKSKNLIVQGFNLSNNNLKLYAYNHDAKEFYDIEMTESTFRSIKEAFKMIK